MRTGTAGNLASELDTSLGGPHSLCLRQDSSTLLDESELRNLRPCIPPRAQCRSFLQVRLSTIRGVYYPRPIQPGLKRTVPKITTLPGTQDVLSRLSPHSIYTKSSRRWRLPLCAPLCGWHGLTPSALVPSRHLMSPKEASERCPSQSG